MGFTKNRLAVWPMLLALLAGCDDGDSDKSVPADWYSTNDIYAYMKAVQNESGKVTTTVELRDGPGNDARYLYLRNDEKLYSSLDTPPKQYFNYSSELFSNSLQLSQQLKVMSARNLYHDYYLFGEALSGKTEYFSSNTLADGAAAKRAYVAFERNGNLLTGESFVDFPAAFEIQSPASEAAVSRATPLELTWSDADPATTMELDVAGICNDGNRYTLHLNLGADSGNHTLNSADYFPADKIEASQSCRVAFLLQRTRLAGVSSQFAFGSFKGVQLRTVEFTSNP